MTDPTALDDRKERREVVEQRRDRLRLSHEAGYGTVSFLSVSFGVVAAVGKVVLAVGVVLALIRAIGVDTGELSEDDWRRWGVAAGVFVVALGLGAGLTAGYVAGRMARRAGLLHGLVAALSTVVVAAIAFGIAYAEDGVDVIVNRLEQQGAPDDGWAGIVAVTVLAAIAAAVVGGVLGGTAGERWHQRLADRALDPARGPAADLEKSRQRLEKAEARLERQREKALQRGVLMPTRTTGETPVTVFDGDADAEVEKPEQPGTVVATSEAPAPTPSPEDGPDESEPVAYEHTQREDEDDEAFMARLRRDLRGGEAAERTSEEV